MVTNLNDSEIRHERSLQMLFISSETEHPYLTSHPYLTFLTKWIFMFFARLKVSQVT